MDERRDPQTNAPDEGELLAAYLDGDTDEVTSARIERRLRTDPRTAGKLDALADAVARLQRLDDVEPPAGFRERLDARLHAERSAGGSTAHTHAPARRSHTSRFAPLAAAASLVLVVVLGGAVVLGARTASDEAGGDAAAVDADAEAPGAIDAPMLARPDDGAEDSAEGAAEAGERDAPIQEEAGAADDALPAVTSEREITRRLGQPAQATSDPVAREAQLRARADLPAAPTCLDDVDATAVDLVEHDGRQVLTALVDERGGSRAVLFDPLTCARVESFEP